LKTFVLFDIDGTLLFSNKIDSRCFADSYEAVFGRTFPSINWHDYPQVTDHVIFRSVFHKHFDRLPAADERQQFEDYYIMQLEAARRKRPTDFQEVPGARSCWEYLNQDERYVTGIATGGWREPAMIKLRHIGLPTSPPYAGYANGMETRRHILQAAIDTARREHQIDKLVYVGDAIWDVQTTQEMNLPLIGIRRKGDHEVLLREGAPIVLSDYRNLDTFLGAIRKLTGS